MFRRAILRLTLFFSVVQLLVFGGFAVAIYAFVTTAFDYDQPEGDTAIATNATELAFVGLRTGLLLSFALLLIVVPFISYVMARHTLAPVRLAYEAQERFVDDASHEFRTPLSVLSGEIELALLRPRSREDYILALERSLDTVEQMGRLTNDLLLLSRGGDTRIESMFDLIRLQEVALAALPRGDREDLRPALTLNFDGDPRVRGSRELLTRAVANVIENAMKFTPQAGGVRITVAERASLGTIEIADSGPGFPAGSEGRVFDRFWRAETTQSIPGHGLGLALVRQILTAHNGRVTAGSAPNSGAVVTIELPKVIVR